MEKIFTEVSQSAVDTQQCRNIIFCQCAVCNSLSWFCVNFHTRGSRWHSNRHLNCVYVILVAVIRTSVFCPEERDMFWVFLTCRAWHVVGKLCLASLQWNPLKFKILRQSVRHLKAMLYQGKLGFNIPKLIQACLKSHWNHLERNAKLIPFQSKIQMYQTHLI